MNNEIKEILDALEVQFKEFTTDYSLLLTIKQQKVLLDYITNLQQDNTMYARLKDEYEEEIKDLQQKNDKAIEYLTSYDAISTIQGLDNIKKNKELDENTMNIMTNRYLEVHHKLLNILQGDSNE